MSRGKRWNNDKLILLQGLDDFIVVDTKDVLLICKKDKEQDIKEYVAEVKRNKGDKYLWPAWRQGTQIVLMISQIWALLIFCSKTNFFLHRIKTIGC